MTLYSSWNNHIQGHWGKSTWDAIFLLAADFPHERECTDDTLLDKETVQLKRKYWRQFFESLPIVLSCGICGQHFYDYMHRDNGAPFKQALNDRESLFEWLYKCKDEINKRTKRRSVPLQKVRTKYIKKCSKGKEMKHRGYHRAGLRR